MSQDNNVNKNHNSNTIGNIISSVMRDTATESNRQGELIVAMFEDAINYSGVAIEELFKKSGTELTTATDEILCAIAPDYDELSRKHFALNETLKTIKKNDRKAADAHALELMIKKQRSARVMLHRALHGVYALRVLDASKAVISSAGATKVVKYSVFDAEMEENVGKTSSASALAQDGNKALRKALGKSSKASAPNPNSDKAKGESVKNSVKAIGTVMQSMRDAGKPLYTVDMDETTETMAMTALRELMIAAFGDDQQQIDIDDATSFIETVNAEIAQAKKANAEKKAA